MRRPSLVSGLDAPMPLQFRRANLSEGAPWPTRIGHLSPPRKPAAHTLKEKRGEEEQEGEMTSAQIGRKHIRNVGPTWVGN